MRLFVNTGENGATQVAARLLDLLLDMRIEWQGQTLPVRGSVGMATLLPIPAALHSACAPPPQYFEQVYVELLAAVDDALYEAKREVVADGCTRQANTPGQSWRKTDPGPGPSGDREITKACDVPHMLVAVVRWPYLEELPDSHAAPGYLLVV